MIQKPCFYLGRMFYVIPSGSCCLWPIFGFVPFLTERHFRTKSIVLQTDEFVKDYLIHYFLLIDFHARAHGGCHCYALEVLTSGGCRLGLDDGVHKGMEVIKQLLCTEG